MSTNTIILITIAAAIIIFVAGYCLALKLSKKHIDVVGAAKKADTALDYAQAIATAISPFLPNVADNIIAAVLKYAQQAVTHVEATYKAAIATGTAAADTRQTEATSLIKSALALEGIRETEQIDKLIGTVIPMLVLVLPKTHTAPVAIPAQVAAPAVQ